MHRIIIFFYCLIGSIAKPVSAQFSDDFADGNLTYNPTWTGDLTNFNVVNQELILAAPAATDTSVITTKSKSSIGALWEFKIQMDFNPSASNYCDVYLISDAPSVASISQGYFVRIGGSDDEVSLFRKDLNGIQKIIDGRDDLTDVNTVRLRLRIRRSSDMVWELETDSSGSVSNWYSEGTVKDSGVLASSHFHLICRYTATRSDKFHFDDLIVFGSAFTDTIAPEVKFGRVISSRSVFIEFSEPISTGLPTGSFTLPTGYQITSVHFNAENTGLTLTVDHSLPHGKIFSVQVQLLKDTAGNVLQKTEMQFLFNDISIIRKEDVVISEIRAAPDSKSNLPNTEYVELYNRSEAWLNLSGWKFSDERDTVDLNTFILAPDEFIVLIDSNDVGLWKSWENKLLVQGFPALNNAGDFLSLMLPDNRVVDQITYSDSWYGSQSDAKSGKSLEMIDLNFVCPQRINWTASVDEIGGTPGRINSITNDLKLSHVGLQRVLELTDQSVLIELSGRLDFTHLSETNFQFKPSLPISNIDPISDSTIQIHLPTSFIKGAKVQLYITNAFDCLNGTRVNDRLLFDIPHLPVQGDLIINEVLFNPYPYGSDFVELYNRSHKAIDLNGLSLARIQGDTIGSVSPLTNSYSPLFPGQFVVLTEDPVNLSLFYPSAIQENIVQSKLPGYSDDEGVVILLDSNEVQLDLFGYSEKMHHELLVEPEGVSLERINPDLPGAEHSSWQSAATTSEGASPGYLNSQFISIDDTNGLRVYPAIFSPDNSGYDDVSVIYFVNELPGTVGDLFVLNQEGRVVKKLVDHEILPANGEVVWNGQDDDGRLVKAGYYLIYMWTFNQEGKTVKRKATVVVAYGH